MGTLDSVPVIAVGALRSHDRAAKLAVAEQIRAAAETIGFLYVTDHGVPQATIDGAFAAARDFFALSEADKRAVTVNAGHRGYIPFGNSVYREGLRPNLNESFIFGPHLDPDAPEVRAGLPTQSPNQWPAAMPSLRATAERYLNAMLDLGKVLERGFALALDLPEDFFGRYFHKPTLAVRLLHYPPHAGPRPDNEFGAASHSDYGFLTILAQDAVGGLELCPRGRDWIAAPSLPGTFIVNIGDMLMRWTNDRLVSTPHRVINVTDRERYSIPFFYDPSLDTEVACIETCTGPDRPARYPPTSWGAYLKERFDSIYAYRKPA